MSTYRLGADPGSLSSKSETVKKSGGRVESRVSSGEGTGQDSGVDDRWKTLDADGSESDNERR